ncbi:DUF3515 domain-containing protein [Mycobacterium sp. pW049]|uniref:DUF3515 domain-containing protein n=1 Tax=[Mycobacterium] bulgaricum TaxID=3238985 RepID=UPI00351B0367
MNSQTGDNPPRAVLIAALALAVAGIIGVLVAAFVMQRSPAQDPVAVSGLPAPQADSPECRALLDALPDELGGYRRASLVDPAPPGAAAWQPDEAGEALILRCGLDRPADFVVGAPLQVVDTVSWFRVDEAGVGEDVADPAGDGRSTWFAVDRPVYVALTLPPGSGPTPIQTLSKTIAETLHPRQPDPAPVR